MRGGTRGGGCAGARVGVDAAEVQLQEKGGGRAAAGDGWRDVPQTHPPYPVSSVTMKGWVASGHDAYRIWYGLAKRHARARGRVDVCLPFGPQRCVEPRRACSRRRVRPGRSWAKPWGSWCWVALRQHGQPQRRFDACRGLPPGQK